MRNQQEEDNFLIFSFEKEIVLENCFDVSNDFLRCITFFYGMSGPVGAKIRKAAKLKAILFVSNFSNEKVETSAFVKEFFKNFFC